MKRPCCVILCGLPGSGKSTYALDYIKRFGGIHLSSDLIRKELYGDESIQENPNEIFSLMKKRAIETLNNGIDVIYDSTGMTRKDRAGIISVCPKFAKIECHIIWAPIEVCIERDAARKRTVGKEVIDRMLKRFQAPFFDEGISDIIINRTDYSLSDVYVDMYFDNIKIPHDNPHHTLNIYDHCCEAYNYICNKTDNEDLKYAALIHDIGKSYTKAFIDSKGNVCEDAHYYQHQCVGSYMSYGIRNITPYIAWLISTHMDPFMNTKYYKSLPQFLKKDIDLLHEADKNAH